MHLALNSALRGAVPRGLPRRPAEPSARARILASLALGFCAPYSAASAQSLPEAIERAYRENPSLQAGRYDQRAVDEGVAQADSELRPNANLQMSASIDRTIQGRTTAQSNLFGPSRFTNDRNQVALSVTQPLYTGGKATADRRGALAEVQSSRAALRGIEGDLMLSVISAYLDVRRYTAELDVWRASVTELEKIGQEIKARQQAGELTRTDIAQSQAQLEVTRQQVTGTEQMLESARADFASLVGTMPGALSPEPSLPHVPETSADAFDQAAQRSPELARALFTEQSSRERIVAARAAGRPTLALRGTANVGGDIAPYSWRDQDQNYTASLVLSVPLSAGGLVASQKREAIARNSADRLRIEGARREMVRTVSDAWNQMVSAQRIATLAGLRRTSAATQLDGMLEEYRVGLRSTFDVLYAQQSLRDAQVSLLDAERNRYVSQAALLRRIGMLEADGLVVGMQPASDADYLKAARRRLMPSLVVPAKALDGLGAGVPRHRPLESPAATPDPAMVSAGTAPLVEQFARNLPLTPLPETTARSVPIKRKHP